MFFSYVGQPDIFFQENTAGGTVSLPFTKKYKRGTSIIRKKKLGLTQIRLLSLNHVRIPRNI